MSDKESWLMLSALAVLAALGFFFIWTRSTIDEPAKFVLFLLAVSFFVSIIRLAVDLYINE